VLVPFVLEGVAGIARLNQADGIHPTEEGQRMMADLIWTAIRPLLDRGR
jgi:acyl-CoA thioesterase-1